MYGVWAERTVVVIGRVWMVVSKRGAQCDVFTKAALKARCLLSAAGGA